MKPDLVHNFLKIQNLTWDMCDVTKSCVYEVCKLSLVFTTMKNSEDYTAVDIVEF